jgi:hypothetical protein
LKELILPKWARIKGEKRWNNPDEEQGQRPGEKGHRCAGIRRILFICARKALTTYATILLKISPFITILKIQHEYWRVSRPNLDEVCKAGIWLGGKATDRQQWPQSATARTTIKND